MYDIKIVKIYQRRHTLFVDGEQISAKEFAEKLGLNVVTINTAIAQKKKQRIVNWLVRHKYGMRRYCNVYWHDGNCMFLDDVMYNTDINNAAASVRARRWVNDGDDDVLYRPRSVSAKNFLNKSVVYEKGSRGYTTTVVPVKKRFSRLKTCLRYKGQEKCEHYDSCSEHRMMNGCNHSRQLDDGSCYSYVEG